MRDRVRRPHRRRQDVEARAEDAPEQRLDGLDPGRGADSIRRKLGRDAPVGDEAGARPSAAEGELARGQHLERGERRQRRHLRSVAGVRNERPDAAAQGPVPVAGHGLDPHAAPVGAER